MRDPLNLIPIEYNNDEYTIISIDHVPEYDIEDYDLFDDGDMKKYISSVEKDVRGSYEYKQMIQYMRENMDMNKCSFYQNVNNIDTTKIKIEIHHEPITLYDICIIVFNKRKFYHESLEEEMVAKEVMYLHYNLLIGLIPVAETVHELIHNQYLFVPTDKVLGKYKEFVELYHPFMLPEQFDILNRIEEATNSYNNDFQDLLQRNYIYLDLSGAYNFPKMEDVIQSMKNRIDDIRNKKNNNLIVPAFFENIKKRED